MKFALMQQPSHMYLFVSENDDAGGHHGVGQQGADGHEVHQHVQVKYGTDQGYKQQFLVRAGR